MSNLPEWIVFVPEYFLSASIDLLLNSAAFWYAFSVKNIITYPLKKASFFRKYINYVNFLSRYVNKNPGIFIFNAYFLPWRAHKKAARCRSRDSPGAKIPSGPVWHPVFRRSTGASSFYLNPHKSAGNRKMEAGNAMVGSRKGLPQNDF